MSAFLCSEFTEDERPKFKFVLEVFRPCTRFERALPEEPEAPFISPEDLFVDKLDRDVIRIKNDARGFG